MKKYEFDEAWSNLCHIDMFDWKCRMGTGAERLMTALHESVEQAPFTGDLSKLLRELVWGVDSYAVGVCNASESQSVMEMIMYLTGRLETMCRNTSVGVTELSAVVAYLLEHAEESDDHALNIVVGLLENEHFFQKFRDGITFYAKGIERYGVLLAHSLALSFSFNDVAKQMLRWILDGGVDPFGWGIRFSDAVMPDKSLAHIATRMTTLKFEYRNSHSWLTVFANGKEALRKVWCEELQPAVLELYSALDHKFSCRTAGGADGKLAVLTPAQVMASIFGADVVIKEGV